MGQTGRLSCACKLLRFVCPGRKAERSCGVVLEHLHAGLRPEDYVFESTVPKHRLLSLPCSFLNRPQASSRVCSLASVSTLPPFLLSAVFHHS